MGGIAKAGPPTDALGRVQPSPGMNSVDRLADVPHRTRPPERGRSRLAIPRTELRTSPALGRTPLRPRLQSLYARSRLTRPPPRSFDRASGRCRAPAGRSQRVVSRVLCESATEKAFTFPREVLRDEVVVAAYRYVGQRSVGGERRNAPRTRASPAEPAIEARNRRARRIVLLVGGCASGG